MPEIIHPKLEGICVQAKPCFREGRAPMVTLIDDTADQNHPLTTKLTLEFQGIQVNAVIAKSNLVADYGVHTKVDGPDKISVGVTVREWAINPAYALWASIALEDAGCAMLFYDIASGLSSSYTDVLCKVLAEGIPLYIHSGITQEDLHRVTNDKSLDGIGKLINEEWHDGNIAVPQIVFLSGFDEPFWVYAPPGVQVY